MLVLTVLVIVVTSVTSQQASNNTDANTTTTTSSTAPASVSSSKSAIQHFSTFSQNEVKSYIQSYLQHWLFPASPTDTSQSSNITTLPPGKFKPFKVPSTT